MSNSLTIDSPMTQLAALRERVRRCLRDNPELTVADVCRRFDIGQHLLNKLRGDAPVFPKGYQVACRAINSSRRGKHPPITIEAVTAQKEAGRVYCKGCFEAGHAHDGTPDAGWFPREQFQHGPTGDHTGRHNAPHCQRTRKPKPTRGGSCSTQE